MDRAKLRRGEGALGIKFYVGLSIVLFYAALGTYSMFSGYIASMEAMWEADSLAQPLWAAYISNPGLPPTMIEDLDGWSAPGQSPPVSISSTGGRVYHIKLPSPGLYTIISSGFDYPYKPAKSMIVDYSIRVSSPHSVRYQLNISLVSDAMLGKKVLVSYGGVREEIEAGRYYMLRAENVVTGSARIYNASIKLPYPFMNRIQDPQISVAVNPVNQILLDQGTRVRGVISIEYTCIVGGGCGELEVEVAYFRVKILGLVHGIMGTDHRGADVWRQFVEGARVANLFGLSAAATTVAIAVVVGSIAGFRIGRLSDHALTFITDTVFFLPAVPLIMVSTAVFGRAMLVLYGLIVLVSWPGLARLIRAWTTAIRSEQYVEAAVAIGADRLWILRRHVIPRLAPLAVYGLVSLVPGVISTEILIQFIGFGDPNIPSWGRMLNEAYNEGALINGAWWWLFAPLVGVSSYMAGFVLIGMDLEEKLNPKLTISSRRTR